MHCQHVKSFLDLGEARAAGRPLVNGHGSLAALGYQTVGDSPFVHNVNRRETTYHPTHHFNRRT